MCASEYAQASALGVLTLRHVGCRPADVLGRLLFDLLPARRPEGVLVSIHLNGRARSRVVSAACSMGLEG